MARQSWDAESRYRPSRDQLDAIAVSATMQRERARLSGVVMCWAWSQEDGDVDGLAYLRLWICFQ